MQTRQNQMPTMQEIRNCMREMKNNSSYGDNAANDFESSAQGYGYVETQNEELKDVL